jgi:hypothetical protein
MSSVKTSSPSKLETIKQVGTGLAFILFPLLFIFAFAVHPGLLTPRFLGPQELILRAHQNGLLQFAHVLVTLSPVLLVVVALKFKSVLELHSAGWAGLLGAALAIFGAMMLAADKGALCLTMSALDTLPQKEFGQFMPGLLAMFSKAGWLSLLWGLLFLPFGFAIQTIALLKTNSLPRWQSSLFLIGVLLVGTPDGAEIVNLSASLLMAVALIPYGMRIIAGRESCLTMEHFRQAGPQLLGFELAGKIEERLGELSAKCRRSAKCKRPAKCAKSSICELPYSASLGG